MRKTPRVEKREKVKTCYIYQQNPDGHERCHRAKEKKERKYQLQETTWKQIKYFFFTDRFKVSTKPDIVQGPVGQSPILLIRD